MKIKIIVCWLAFATLFLTGCMYPENQLAKNQIAYKDQLRSVQMAVDSFQKDNRGILPIKTEPADTPIYQKYPIDFKKLIPKYLSDPPGNAYENGGIYEYVLVNAETKPTVKLFDLRIANTIQEIQLRIKAGGYPPFKKVLAKNVYSIDFTKLGYEQTPFAVSPFTNQNLPFVITSDVKIYVDYSSDLNQALKKRNVSVKAGEDIRPMLMKDSMFVPAYSLPYTIDQKTNEPIFLEKNP